MLDYPHRAQRYHTDYRTLQAMTAQVCTQLNKSNQNQGRRAKRAPRMAMPKTCNKCAYLPQYMHTCCAKRCQHAHFKTKVCQRYALLCTKGLPQNALQRRYTFPAYIPRKLCSVAAIALASAGTTKRSTPLHRHRTNQETTSYNSNAVHVSSNPNHTRGCTNFGHSIPAGTHCTMLLQITVHHSSSDACEGSPEAQGMMIWCTCKVLDQPSVTIPFR